MQSGKISGSLAEPIQIKTHGTLTQVHQQQILQTIKEKILPQTTLLNSSQPQQIIVKHKTLPKQQVLGATQQQTKITLGMYV